MKYDRLTRTLKLDVKGVEYSLRLSIGMFEELEDSLPKGTTLMNMFLNQETPKIKVVRKAFCLGVTKDGKRISNDEALKAFEDYCDENGVQGAVSVFYALLAVSHLLGATASNELLKGLGLVDKDAGEQEKNV